MFVDLATLGIRVDASQVDKADRNLEQLEKTGRKVENTAINMGKALAAAFVGLGLVSITRQAVELADAYSNMQGRLSLVTKGTAELGVVTDRLYQISQRSRGSFEATSDLYAKLAQSTQELKVNQSDLLQVTETISKALIVSGAGAQESEGALRQLGQAFASGALRGDELNSIMEGTPRIARAIAEGMGITIGQLRAFGKEGKLTGGAIFDALLSQQAIIEEEFSKMPVTVGQSLVTLQNSLLLFVGATNEAFGVTEKLAGGIQFIAENMDKAGPIAAALAGILFLSLAPSIYKVILATTTATAGYVANTIAVVSNTAAMIAMSASISLTGTVSAATATAVRGLGAAFVFLSGIGVVALLAAVAAGFAYLSANAYDAEKATAIVDNATRTYTGALSSLADYQKKVGIDTTSTNAALDAALGITAQTTTAADGAAAAAERRAAAERQLTDDILRRAAAELRADGEKLMRSAALQRGMATASTISGNLILAAPGSMFDDMAEKDFRSAEANSRRAASNSTEAAGLLTRSAQLSRYRVTLAGSPLTTAGTERTNTPTASGAANDNGGRTAQISEEARELERATEAAKDYAAQLTIETNEIGKNEVQTRMAAVARAAALAPMGPLRDAIVAAGNAWQEANQKAATDDLIKSLTKANDQVEFENSLQNMNAKEREVANAQRAISIALAEAEANGTPISTEAIKAQTEAILANAAARGQEMLDSDNADGMADRIAGISEQMRDATDGVRGLFGTIGEGLANSMDTWSEYRSHVGDILAELESIQGDNETSNARRAELNNELARAEIDNYGNMLSSAKSFFDEKSGAYKALQAAEQAYRIYQFAMAVKAMFFDTAETTAAAANAAARMTVDGVETGSSVAKSGIRAAADGVAAFAKTLASLPFPFNLAAGAVVLAALVGVGVAMKGSGGGSSKGATESANDREFEKPSTYTPFISQDTYANDNRVGTSSRGAPITPEPSTGRSPVGNTKVFDFSGANFSNANPDDIKRTIVDTFNEQLKDDLLADAREQNAEDMKQLGRQRLGG